VCLMRTTMALYIAYAGENKKPTREDGDLVNVGGFRETRERLQTGSLDIIIDELLGTVKACRVETKIRTVALLGQISHPWACPVRMALTKARTDGFAFRFFSPSH